VRLQQLMLQGEKKPLHVANHVHLQQRMLQEKRSQQTTNRLLERQARFRLQLRVHAQLH
jgi:hypothetical protein